MNTQLRQQAITATRLRKSDGEKVVRGGIDLSVPRTPDARDGLPARSWGLLRARQANLRLHLEHFGGQSATAALPTTTWAGPRDATWARFTDALGIPATPAVGERVEVNAPDAPALAGTVAEAAPWRIALVLDQPAPGTAILAVEGDGEQVQVSIWSYLYGTEGAAAAARDEPLWQQWLTERALTTG